MVAAIGAFLPFLPLLEDAMIRQLGDDDFAKREAATPFLEKVLQDTEAVKNYWALVRVKVLVHGSRLPSGSWVDSPAA
jgi:hypothetical protein